MNSGVYSIRNTVNEKRYIGSTNDFEQRKKQHFCNLKNGKHINVVLQRAYHKYGSDSMVFEIIEICEVNKMFEREAFYIDYYMSRANDRGYNIGSVGGGDNLSLHPNREEIIEKIISSIKERNDSLTQEEKNERWARYGEDNPNWRGGISSCKTCGKKLSKRPVSGQCSSCGGRKDVTGKNNPFYEKNHTENTKAIISEKTKERFDMMSDDDYKNHPQTVSVSINGEVIHGLSRAGRKHGIGAALVRYRCLSKSLKWKEWFYVNI